MLFVDVYMTQVSRCFGEITLSHISEIEAKSSRKCMETLAATMFLCLMQRGNKNFKKITNYAAY
jgi:hypothetical protein